MKIDLIRKTFTDKSTIGEVYINGAFFSFSLEDKDRNLYQNTPLEEIRSIKVFGETCIPYGTYKVIYDYSQHFKKNTPHIIEVPGFESIRIHAGNRPEDTEGCILIGYTAGEDIIQFSLPAINNFLNYYFLPSISRNEEITIEIKKKVIR